MFPVGTVPRATSLILRSLRFPPVVGLRFLKRGHSTKSVAIQALWLRCSRDGTSPEQLTAIYGVPKPPFAPTRPLPFVACLLARSKLRFPTSCLSELTIIYDGE